MKSDKDESTRFFQSARLHVIIGRNICSETSDQFLSLQKTANLLNQAVFRSRIWHDIASNKTRICKILDYFKKIANRLVWLIPACNCNTNYASERRKNLLLLNFSHYRWTTGMPAIEKWKLPDDDAESHALRHDNKVSNTSLDHEVITSITQSWFIIHYTIATSNLNQIS